MLGNGAIAQLALAQLPNPLVLPVTAAIIATEINGDIFSGGLVVSTPAGAPASQQGVKASLIEYGSDRGSVGSIEES